jgi:hypothetical protein
MIYHIVIASDFSEKWIPLFGPMLLTEHYIISGRLIAEPSEKRVIRNG